MAIEPQVYGLMNFRRFKSGARCGCGSRRLATPGRAAALLAVLLTACLASSAQAITLTLVNETGRTLVPYPVNPATGEREQDLANALDQGQTALIDVAGFNPVYVFEPGINDADLEPNGFFIGLDLLGTPAMIQYKLFHYKVAPGQAGVDPTLQPSLIEEEIEDVDAYLPNVVMTVDAHWNVCFNSSAGSTEVYDNFGGAFSGDDVGLTIVGPTSASPTPMTQGLPFTVEGGDAHLASIDLVLSYGGVGPNLVTVELRSDNLSNPANWQGEPGVVIESALIAGVPVDATRLAAIYSGTTLLTNGTSYWVVLSGMDDSQHLWVEPEESPNGLRAFRFNGGSWIVADDEGGPNQGAFRVNAGCSAGNQPPVAVCRDVTVSADAACAAVVMPADVDDGSFDPDAGDTISFELDPPGPYLLGETLVTLTVTDNNGLMDACQATILVVDDTPPSATAGAIDACYPTAAEAEASAIAATTDLSDNCTAPGDLSVTAATLGTCAATVTVTVTDAVGNATPFDYATRIDATAPVVTCAADVTVEPTSPAGAEVTFSSTATDDCDGDVTVTCTPPTGSTFAMGTTTTVTCTAADGCGNSGSCTLTVTVLTLEAAIDGLIEAVEALVDAGVLNRGQSNALVVKLEAALRSLGRGRVNAACNQLRAFMNQVNAFIASGKLTAEEGQALLDSVNNIRSAAGCDPVPAPDELGAADSDGAGEDSPDAAGEGPSGSGVAAETETPRGSGCGTGAVPGVALLLAGASVLLVSRRTSRRRR